VIDWHSHILPGVDDGSRNMAESLTMLRMLREQGVDTVIATPHFYANERSVNRFLKKRNNALEELRTQLTGQDITIVPGAEVKYYPGISRMSDLKQLCIEGSGLLLLEMPMSKWTEYTMRELVELSSTSGMTVVLAHIERYWGDQSRAAWSRLYDCGILMQTNASFFNSILTRKKALRMIEEGAIHFIGSDCHNTSTRAPHMDRAVQLIEKKLGRRFLDQMNEYGRAMFL